MANAGVEKAISEDPAIKCAVNTYHGKILHQGVAEAFGRYT
jgi:alanine dehydrogenase